MNIRIRSKKAFYICVNKKQNSSMKNLNDALKQKNFKWLPKHLNHIAENIVFKNRNISYLAINEVFRVKDTEYGDASFPFTDSYYMRGFLKPLPNDLLRTKEGVLTVIFKIDNQSNIIPITAYDKNDSHDN